MSRKRLSMRKVREVLRLLWDKQQSHRAVASACRIARSSVGEYERRAREAGLSWPLPAHLDDEALEVLLYPPSSTLPLELRPEPNYALIDRQLALKGVTRQLLWLEYKSGCADAYEYSRFCQGLREWRDQRGLSMRQTHLAGEKVFVDYAGQTMPVIDPESGEVRQASIFVAALGASHYTYVEATWGQGLADWVMSHVRMLAFFGGCPQIIVPDNLKAAVKKAHRFEPELNPTYAEFAAHYGVAVIPARVRKPQDKSVVESAVQVVSRWILAKLRNQEFFSLFDLNDAIWELLAELNGKPFQKRPGSRLSVFEELDRPALTPLPAERFVLAEWKKVRPHVDYHVQVDKNYYSIPYQFNGAQLDVRLTGSTIEVFHEGKRVASHARSHRKGLYTTVKEHMPQAHQAHAGMTVEKLLAWAASIGPFTRAFIEGVIDSRAHPQQAFRSCLGTLNLTRKGYSRQRLEAACQRAVSLGSYALKSVEAILKNNLDEQPLEVEQAELPRISHENIRGSSFFTTPASKETTTLKADQRRQ